MSVPRVVYDAKFNEFEQRRIRWLRKLDSRRKSLAWLFGTAACILVFLSQVPFRGVEFIHFIATYVAVPAGLAVGLGVNFGLDRFIEKEFVSKWDRIFLERSELSEAHWAAISEILSITDRMEFYSLTESKQREIIEQVNRMYGIP